MYEPAMKKAKHDLEKAELEKGSNQSVHEVNQSIENVRNHFAKK